MIVYAVAAVLALVSFSAVAGAASTLILRARVAARARWWS